MRYSKARANSKAHSAYNSNSHGSIRRWLGHVIYLLILHQNFQCQCPFNCARDEMFVPLPLNSTVQSNPAVGCRNVIQ